MSMPSMDGNGGREVQTTDVQMGSRLLRGFCQLALVAIGLVGACSGPAHADLIQTRTKYKLVYVYAGPPPVRYRDTLAEATLDAHADIDGRCDVWGVCTRLLDIRPAAAPYDIRMDGVPELYDGDIEYCTRDGNCHVETRGRIGINAFCPDGFQLVNNATYDASRNRHPYCWRDEQFNPDPPPDSCPATPKPVFAETGLKRQVETDYLDPLGALTFNRTWRSDWGRFVQVGDTLLTDLSQLVQPSDVCFNGRYAVYDGVTATPTVYRYCFPCLGDGTLTVRYLDPEGNRSFFYSPSGSIYKPAPDGRERLVKIAGAQGQASWALARDDNSMETFDANGRLLSRIYRTRGGLGGGYIGQVTYQYSDAGTPPNIAPKAGLLIRISDRTVLGGQGRSLGLAYNRDATLKSLTLPNGDTISYTYDGAGANCPTSGTPPLASSTASCQRLSSVSYPDGSQRRYHYSEADHLDPALQSAVNYSGKGYLTGITDETGARLSHYRYDDQGRATSSGWGGYDYHLAYDSPYQTTVTDTLGSRRIYGHQLLQSKWWPTTQSQPAGSGCSSSSSAITYDPNGNVASRTDFNGSRTTYTYDLARNLELTRTEASGTPQARTLTTAWHPDWRLETKRAEPKKLTTWIYNGQPDPFASNAIAACAPSTALLPDGKPIAVLCKKVEQATTDTTGASGFAATLTGNPRVNSWTYNGYGQVLTANGPRTDVNDTTTYSYYPSTDFSDPTAGHTLGDLWKVTNPAGHVTEHLAYDKNGRLLKTKDPNGLVTLMTYSPRGWLKTRQVGSELTTYDYDAVGQLKKVTAPDGSWIGFDYDPAHRLVATYDNRNNKIAYTLDNAGNRIKEDVTDPAGYLVRTQTRVYDALSRLQNVIQPQ